MEQIQIGMIFEVQEEERPWTLWFVRVIENRGGRLRLRYVLNIDQSNENPGEDLFIYYLHWRFHSVRWTSKQSNVYSYEIPRSAEKLDVDRNLLMEFCLKQSENQILSEDLFKEQEEIRSHRFVQGMKFEVFDEESQHIYLGRIGEIHNEFYFDVWIEKEEERKFLGYATHPFLLPAHWAAEHRLALMKGKDLRQSEDFWNSFTEKHGIASIATEKCFHLIKLNSNGNHRVEPGMKMELICNKNQRDYLFSVTLVHVADHLMWLRIDNPTIFNDEAFAYRVVPINSLDIFPVGWAKFNGYQLITPFEYHVQFKTFEHDRAE